MHSARVSPLNLLFKKKYFGNKCFRCVLYRGERKTLIGYFSATVILS